MKLRYLMLGAALAFSSHGAMAQEDNEPGIEVGSSEIVVTGIRRELDSFDASVPAIGLKRTADFAVQPIYVEGDTRDEKARHDEIYQTIRRLVESAPGQGIQVAFGEIVVDPVTIANFKDLTLAGGGRADTNRVALLLKTPLAGGGNARDALARIDRFIKSVKPVGRALVEKRGDMTLSIVAPDQYRPAVAKAVADDAAAMAAKFGPNYAVEVRGLNRPVEWTRAGLTEVLLYIPYELAIVPRP
jgi:hypothetical protein